MAKPPVVLTLEFAPDGPAGGGGQVQSSVGVGVGVGAGRRALAKGGPAGEMQAAAVARPQRAPQGAEHAAGSSGQIPASAGVGQRSAQGGEPARSTGRTAHTKARVQTRGGARGAAGVDKALGAPARRLAVLVLGMHRSGTSALARTLSLLGCDLPRNLMAGDVGNEAGHWESHAGVSLNDALLASAGSRWDDWLPLNPGWYASPVYADFLERGRAVLREDFGASRLLVLKDPRNCRLMPFWLAVLAAEEVSPLVVLPIRNPLEVAESLAARDGMDPEYGLMLWLRHVLEAEFATRGQARAFCGYDQLLEDWQAVAERLQEQLGVVWPRRSLAADDEVGAFLEQARRHQVVQPQAVLGNSSISLWVRQCYAVMLRWAGSGEAAADWSLLDDIRVAFDRAGPAFAPLVLANLRQSQGVGAAARERAELMAQLAAERARLAEAEAALLAPRGDAAGDGGVAGQARAGRELDAEQGAELAAIRAQCQQAEAEKGHMAARNAALAARLQQQDEALSASTAELAAADAGLRAAEQVLASERERLVLSEAERLELAARLGDIAAAVTVARGEAVWGDVAPFSAQFEAAQDAAGAAPVAVAGASGGSVLDAVLCLLDHRRELAKNLAAREADVIARDAGVMAAEQAVTRVREELAGLMLTHAQDAARADRAEREVANLASGLARQQYTAREAWDTARAAWAEAAAARGAAQAQMAEVRRLVAEKDRMAARLWDMGERVAHVTADLRLTQDRVAQGEEALCGERRTRLAAEAAARDLGQRLDATAADMRGRLDLRTTEMARLTGLYLETEADLAAAVAHRHALEEQLLAAGAETGDTAAQLAAARHEGDQHRAELAARTAELDRAAAELGVADAARQTAEARLSETYGDVAALTRELLGQVEQAEASDAEAQWLRAVSAALLAGEPWWWRAVPEKWRRRRRMARLQTAGLFDAGAYLARYPDVAAAGIHPLRHYILHGMHEGRGQ